METEVDAGFPLSDADLIDPPEAEAEAASAVVPPDVQALLRLSRHLGGLLLSGFGADVRIAVAPRGPDDVPREVPAHRCVLAMRSPFFRAELEKKESGAEARLELGDLVKGFEVGFDALMAVLDYVYTGQMGALPGGVCECVDEECPHVACRPPLDFMLQVLYAAFTFEISELVNVFQRRLLAILEMVQTDDILVILCAANLCRKSCMRLLNTCIEIVVKSDIENVTLEKTLPPDVFMHIMKSRSSLGLDGPESLSFPDKNVKNIYGALDSDDIELLKLLLQEGHTTLDKAYALHYAVAHCDSKIPAKLLDLGLADVNHKNPRGYTVLHVAAMRKEPKIIVSLLQKGARPSDLTSDGKKAIQISKRRTRYVDYRRSTNDGEASPKDRLCIEVLEQAEREEQNLQEIPFPLALASDNLYQNLLDLETRVCMAKHLFPMEAKVALENADLDGILDFTSILSTNLSLGDKRTTVHSYEIPFKMTEEYIQRMKALRRTVELGVRYFPRCSKVLNKILNNDISVDLEHNTSEERKKRYREIQEEILNAFTLDKEECDGSALSVSTSKSQRAARSKVAKKRMKPQSRVLY